MLCDGRRAQNGSAWFGSGTMVYKAIVLACMLAGGIVASQLPAFSQQYIQRLGGAVDELTLVTQAYDRDAAAVGLSREQALVQQSASGEFGALRADNMAATFARQRDLQASLDALQNTVPYQRVALAMHFRDQDVARAALDAFEPAVPLTATGAVFALAGAFLGWCVSRLVLALFGALRRIFVRGGRSTAP